ncbi:hypothetical protein Q2T83_01560 [Fervidibacter sacchari]|uniref:PIN domain-containing protein n=1 Tax=Candidatus Fervidibacter sacchari TaxID=1448929 RepID=A0ABT2ET52_9BACT|nr:hypothetical protein [Candidatus Fervidibacter sacchari]MCS3921126.1 hypothetical protein [Candidatus Fervidibacter sacchari]WKU16524.1 hypothetical protein Q2T83_01560 [Candidatus Fervidibacter sacchari]
MSERRNFHDALEPVVYWNTSFVIARGVSAFVSLDEDLLAVDGITVYMPT